MKNEDGKHFRLLKTDGTFHYTLHGKLSNKHSHKLPRLLVWLCTLINDHLYTEN